MDLSRLTIPKPSFPINPPPVFDRYKDVNRVIVIGNGFDLAHGLKSGFKDFVQDYALSAVRKLIKQGSYADELINVVVRRSPKGRNIPSDIANKEVAFQYLMQLAQSQNYDVSYISKFFQKILSDINAKIWVDIELDYFDYLKKIKDSLSAVNKLNAELSYLRSKLTEYLSIESANNSITPQKLLLDQFQSIIYSKEAMPNTIKDSMRPDKMCILNFNYTKIASHYAKELECLYFPIHGQLQGDDIEVQAPVFGYGEVLH